MKCPGCGIELQHENEYQAGYIPFDVFQRRQTEKKEILCQRCFWLKHYHKIKPIRLDQDTLRTLEKVMSESDLVAFVVDISDFEGSFDERIQKLVSNKKTILLVNKIDLIPRVVTIEEMKQWLKTRIDLSKFEKLFLLSAERNYGLKSLSRYIEKFNRVCFVGVTNVGKSSIFNRLSGKKATVTPFPGTTLDILNAKLRDSQTKIVDTPGLITYRRLMDLLQTECQAKLWAVRKLSRMTFKPNSNSSLFIGGMCVIDFNFDGLLRPIFQVFASEKIKFHLTNSYRKQQIWMKHYGRMLVPPCNSEEPRRDSINWVQHEFELNLGDELSIAGLGWLSVRRGPFTVKVTVPENVTITKRIALVNPYKKIEHKRRYKNDKKGTRY